MFCELEPEAPFEPCPDEASFQRKMKSSSLSLLRAVERAQGLYPVTPLPLRPRVRLRVAREAELGRAIVSSVAVAYDMPYDDLIGRSRRQRWVNARMVASRLLRDQRWPDGTARFSTPEIGRILGGRDHTTIIHALNNFPAYAALFPFMASVYDSLRDDAE